MTERHRGEGAGGGGGRGVGGGGRGGGATRMLSGEMIRSLRSPGEGEKANEEVKSALITIVCHQYVSHQ